MSKLIKIFVFLIFAFVAFLFIKVKFVRNNTLYDKLYKIYSKDETYNCIVEKISGDKICTKVDNLEIDGVETQITKKLVVYRFQQTGSTFTGAEKEQGLLQYEVKEDGTQYTGIINVASGDLSYHYIDKNQNRYAGSYYIADDRFTFSGGPIPTTIEENAEQLKLQNYLELLSKSIIVNASRDLEKEKK